MSLYGKLVAVNRHVVPYQGHGGIVRHSCIHAVTIFAIAALTTTYADSRFVDNDPAQWVDPFIGTSANGHTFPAACVPFGLVQAGPDTGNNSWHYCSGYRYEDGKIYGFSQTHLNGTGNADLGDLSILPLARKWEPVAGNGVLFDKATEVAEPGYYAVMLDGGIKVEISAAEHSAIYRIKGERGFRMFVDCLHGLTEGWNDPSREISECDVRVNGKSGLSGTYRRRHWVDRCCSFDIAFDREFRDVNEVQRHRYLLDFDIKGGETLTVKVGLSAKGGVVAAERNRVAEIADWDFEVVRITAREKWNAFLRCAVIDGSDEQKTNWFTSLYHLFIQPNNIADTGEKPLYSTFSLWDTFRSAHPLYTIIARDKVPEMVDSMLEQGRRTGYMPIWTLWGKENQGMIGTHSIPVIVDWFLKEGGENGRNSRKEYWLSAYAQIKDTLTNPHKGRHKERWDLLDKYGYYPFDEIKGESVSRTVECAYDDWCAGVMAEKLGFADDAAFFFKRSENWRNVFDSSIGLVRGKDANGNWREPFNPYALGHGADLANDFTEGNAFQYTWHVMQNPQGLIDAMGGRDVFTKKLDSLFLRPDKVEGDGSVVDVTGLIGQYVQGNEPSHHVIYFYPQVGHPEKAAERIREVFDKFYLPKPDGLCGNDDCGQMSAWYLFSAMGFYPFNPCGGEYILGAPQVPKVALNFAEGKTFTIVAKNLSRENKYVESVMLNGRPVTDWRIHHVEIMAGGELVFEMSPFASDDLKARRKHNVSNN